MKYFINLFQILICCFISVCLMAFVMATIVSTAFTKDNMISHMKSGKYITSQKTKLTGDLQTVSLATGLNSNVFNGLITDKLIIENNEDYINGVFNIGNSSKNQTASLAADQYASNIRAILYDYKTKVDLKVYDMTDAGINSFVNLQRTTFLKSAAPITGFETAVAYINKINKLKFYLLGASFIGAVFLLLINIKRKITGVTFVLFSGCAAGILTALLSGAGLYFITNKATILSQSYLILVMLDYFNTVFMIGLSIFILTQILLFVILFKNEQKKKTLLLPLN